MTKLSAAAAFNAFLMDLVIVFKATFTHKTFVDYREKLVENVRRVLTISGLKVEIALEC